MKRMLLFLALLATCYFVHAQQSTHIDVLKSALQTPAIKKYLPRNSENRICLETIFTRGKLPGNHSFEIDGYEIVLLSKPEPDELSVCQAGLLAFTMGKRRAKVKLVIGQEIQLKFILNKVEGKWYTYWLYTKMFVPVGEEVEVQRTVDKFTY